MKALWLVSFRPIGKSKVNDFFQSIFVDSIKSLDFDITFSLTQFDEENVKEFVEKKKLKNHYINIPKSELPSGKKYSNHLMLKNALNQFIEHDYQYLVCSSADIIVPDNIFKSLSKINKDEFCALIYPNIHITNGVVKNNYWPHYGIDLIAFKISKEKAIKFKELSKFPEVRRDLAIIVDSNISAGEVIDLAKEAAGGSLVNAVIFDQYAGDGIADGKYSIGLGLTWQHHERTLKENEVNSLIDDVLSSLKQRFNASLR